MSAVGQRGARPAPPAPVALAVKLMYAIAALGIIGILLTVSDTGDLRERARTSNPGLSASDLDAAVAIGVTIAVVIGVVGAALWVLFAIFTGRGRGWARIVVTVLAALEVLSGLTSLAGGVSLPDVASLLTLLCAVAVLVLLWRRESSAYFAAAKGSGAVADPGYPTDPGYPPVR